jgi:hypothetical protein
MLLVALIGLSFVLIGIVGLQFSYMFYLDRLHIERRKHIADLERKCSMLGERLERAEKQIAEQDRLLEAAYPGLRKDDEVWADVIEDR